MQAVILAGGLATRMRPRTSTIPKSMLEVGGRPFIAWQLEKLAASGFQDIILCVGHLADRIHDFVGDGSSFGVRIRWSYEETPLGTAGALRAAWGELEDTFIVTYGDSYLPFDYSVPLQLLQSCSDCSGVLAVFCNEGRWDASNVLLDSSKQWIERYEKNPEFKYIDYGAIALRRSVIAHLSARTKLGLDSVQSNLAATRRLRAYVASERFYEIGSPEGLEELDRYLL